MTTRIDGAIGRPLPRVEDARLLDGSAQFVADVRVENVLHAAIVRSPFAHALLRNVDLGEARSSPGVVAVLSASDLADQLPPLPSHRPIDPAWEEMRQRPLAVDRVRYVGEPVAVVIAESRALAEDAAETVIIDADELPVVASAADAPAELFPGHSNTVMNIKKSAGLSLNEALGKADVVVEREFRVQRHSGVPLETRGLLARPDDDGGLTLWGVAKMPHFVRSAVAQMLGLGEAMVRIVPVHVGGGFGVRGELYPEDFLVPYCALLVGRPVRWVEDRVEHMVSINHSRASVWKVRAGATREGELVLLEGEALLDIGAYVRPLVGVVAEQCALNLLGPYRVQSFQSRVLCALTNKTGIGTIRAPGRYEATFAREGILDELAGKLGMDPCDLRERNLLGRDDYPYNTGVEAFGRDVVYDSGDPRNALQVARTTIRQPEPSRDDIAGRRIGVGVVPFIESTGLGPFEMARVSVGESGQVVVRIGTTSMGQGHETSFAQIAADAVGVAVEDVTVLEGDPASVSAGVGTFASRSVVMGGNAVWLAGNALRERIEKLDPDRSLPLEQLVERAAEQGVGLDVEETFENWSTTYAYGAHAAVVAVDPELGSLEILRYLVVADVGRVVNPMIVRGQVQGGVVQGIGGALLEELAYNSDGQPQSTSFMDYLLPSALEAPEVEVMLLDAERSPGNPLGVKGAGEVGTIAVAAALSAAVRDALGVDIAAVNELPLRPDRLAAPAPF